MPTPIPRLPALRFAATLTGLVWMASLAQAATLTITSDEPVYDVGETIRLTVTGESMGGTAFGIFGQLLYDPALTETVASSQTPHTDSFGAPWAIGILPRGDGFANVINQVKLGPLNDATQTQVATATLVAEAAGIVDVRWNEQGVARLDFFGLTSAEGYRFRIAGAAIDPIPEPSSALIFSFALIASSLVLRRTRRRARR